MKNDKLGVVLGAGVSASVILGAAVAIMSGGLDTSMMLMVAGASAMSVGAGFIIYQRMKSMSKGLPAEDELSKRVMQKAAAYAYYFTVWLAVGIMWADALFFEKVIPGGLTTMEIVAAMVLLPGGFFIGLAILLNRTGKV